MVAGRSGKRWKRLVANLRAQHRPCWLCGQPIDYTVTDGPEAFETDHIRTWSSAPALREDPENLAASHKRCNQSRGKADPRPSVGVTSRVW